MAHRTVNDVMTAEVVTVAEDTPFKEVARVLVSHRVSAVPVIDAQGRVAGVVSETDLLRKEEYQDDPGAKRVPRRGRRKARARAAGLTARDVMTSPPVTIRPQASIVAAARALDRHHVRRLVVIGEDGWLAGILTPSDLLDVYLRPDEEIRDQIRREVIVGYLGTDPGRVKITVTEGVVTLAGYVEKKSMTGPAVSLTRAIDGVVDVVSRLGYRIDDTHDRWAADLAGY